MSKSSLKVKIITLIIICIAINVLLIIGVILSLILGTLAQDFNNGCITRYSLNDTGNALVNEVQTFSREITLHANGSYGLIYNSTNNTYQADNQYGQWFKLGTINSPQQIKVTGAVSLCKAYLPSYDLQSGEAANLRERVEIPRVGDLDKTLSLYFPANTGQWRSITEIYEGDAVKIKVEPVVNADNLAQINQQAASNFKSSTGVTGVTVVDAFTKTPVIPFADCSSNIATNVSPLCGRFTPFNQYANGCQADAVYLPKKYCGEYPVGLTDADTRTCRLDVRGWHDSIIPCCNIGNNCETKEYGGAGSTIDTRACRDQYIQYESTPVSINVAETRLTELGLTGSINSGKIKAYVDAHTASYGPSYKAFSNNDPVVEFNSNTTFGHQSNLTQYANTPPKCTTPPDQKDIDSAIAHYKFWLISGDGLVYRLNSNNAAPTTSNYQNSTSDKLPLTINSTNPYLFNQDPVSSADIGGALGLHLQYRYIDNGNYIHNTGGYVLSINHTKCQRVDGKAKSDSGFADRGSVEYIIVPGGIDLNENNNASSYTPIPINLNQSNQATIPFNDSIAAQTLWLRIKNKPADYPDSVGQYKVQISSRIKSGKFTEEVLRPVIKAVTSTVNRAGEQLFKSVTCYQNDSVGCISFFTYIRAMLTLYVMLFGMMFILGRSRLNQEEFIIRVTKILIVAGLMNENTFELFSNYYLKGISLFSDQLIANFGGYAITVDADGEMSNNPFAFLDDVMSRIFFNKTFLYQLFSLMGLGLNSIIILSMTLVGVIVFVIGTLQAIGTYILAKLALSFLFGVAPLFLTLMLFEPTRDIFGKWLSNVIKYTLEPLIVILGLAMLTQLYTVYLDNTLSFSVCFKCAIPFYVPNLSLMNDIPGNLKDVEIFCLPWFVPWGNDPKSGTISVPLPDLAGLLMVAFINFHYVNYAASMVGSITGQIEGPSTIKMGVAASKNFVSTTTTIAKGAAKKVGLFRR